jgi:DNA polymerase III sliding clamp (beta) subunit (PCNA family)
LKIDREKFLHCLESVLPGVSKSDTVQQSSSFCLRNGEVFTFDEETACRSSSPLSKEFQGAVPADKLLNGLRKLPDEELEVFIKESHLVFKTKGGKREFAVRMEEQILLPIDEVEVPKTWTPLHKDFAEAVGVVHRSAGHDASDFGLTCVHIHPEWVEAADGYQACRWVMDTKFKSEWLVRQTAIKCIVSMGMMEFAESSTWVHFRSPSGLIVSCRAYTEEYRRTEGITKLIESSRGEKASLPKGLTEATAIAEQFSRENAEANMVKIQLIPGELKLTGRGISGYYKERKKLNYVGKKLTFCINPKMLTDIVKRHNDVELSDKMLRVNGENYVYMAWLMSPEETKKEEELEEVAA